MHRWTSRKFLVGVCGFIALLANEIWGIEISPEVLIAIVVPLVAFIVGEAVVDATRKNH